MSLVYYTKEYQAYIEDKLRRKINNPDTVKAAMQGNALLSLLQQKRETTPAERAVMARVKI